MVDGSFCSYLRESGGPGLFCLRVSRAYSVCYLHDSDGPRHILCAIYMSPVVQSIFCVLFNESGGLRFILCAIYVSPALYGSFVCYLRRSGALGSIFMLFTQPALLFVLSGDFQKLIFDSIYAAGVTFSSFWRLAKAYF